MNNNNKLPTVSNQFVKVFIDEYNKSNIIKDVMVEYSYKGQQYNEEDKLNSLHAKVNPKDNTITIRKIKDNWDREEHCTDMQYYMEYCESNGYITPMDWLDKYKHY